jgi:FkbM family methyltransferase
MILLYLKITPSINNFQMLEAPDILLRMSNTSVDNKELESNPSLVEWNKRLLYASKKIKRYNHAIGPGVYRLAQRITVVKIPYLLYLLKRFFSANHDLEAQLFFDEVMFVPKMDPNGRHYYYFGTLGENELPLTRFFMRQINKKDICYDIGANYGFYSLLFSKLSGSGPVHSFDPNVNCVNYLKKSSVAKDNIVINQVGIADSKGTLPLYGQESAYGNGTAANSLNKDVGSDKGFIPLYEVPVVTIDDYCNTNPIPTIIKIDIEGGEYGAIQGAIETLTKYDPIVSIEIWGGSEGQMYSKPAVDLLQKLDYRAHAINNDGTLKSVDSIDYDSVDEYFSNFIFIKNEDR